MNIKGLVFLVLLLAVFLPSFVLAGYMDVTVSVASERHEVVYYIVGGEHRALVDVFDGYTARLYFPKDAKGVVGGVVFKDIEGYDSVMFFYSTSNITLNPSSCGLLENRIELAGGMPIGLNVTLSVGGDDFAFVVPSGFRRIYFCGIEGKVRIPTEGYVYKDVYVYASRIVYDGQEVKNGEFTVPSSGRHALVLVYNYKVEREQEVPEIDWWIISALLLAVLTFVLIILFKYREAIRRLLTRYRGKSIEGVEQDWVET